MCASRFASEIVEKYDESAANDCKRRSGPTESGYMSESLAIAAPTLSMVSVTEPGTAPGAPALTAAAVPLPSDGRAP